jgi:hypothetical protein
VEEDFRNLFTYTPLNRNKDLLINTKLIYHTLTNLFNSSDTESFFKDAFNNSLIQNLYLKTNGHTADKKKKSSLLLQQTIDSLTALTKADQWKHPHSTHLYIPFTSSPHLHLGVPNYFTI